MAQTTKALTPRSDSFHSTVRLVLAFPILPLTGHLFLPYPASCWLPRAPRSLYLHLFCPQATAGPVTNVASVRSVRTGAMIYQAAAPCSSSRLHGHLPGAVHRIPLHRPGVY